DVHARLRDKSLLRQSLRKIRVHQQRIDAGDHGHAVKLRAFAVLDDLLRRLAMAPGFDPDADLAAEERTGPRFVHSSAVHLPPGTAFDSKIAQPFQNAILEHVVANDAHRANLGQWYGHASFPLKS